MKRWHMKLLQHISGKSQECCYNVAAKRCMKTSPHYYGNINRQRRDVMIITMLCDNLSAIWENPRKKYQDML